MQRLGRDWALAATMLLTLPACQDILGYGDGPALRPVTCTVDLEALRHDCDSTGPILVMDISEGVTLEAGETIANGSTLEEKWSLPDGMGKVLVNFAGYQELELRVVVEDPSGYVLDIGDSDTNDGGGGDRETTSFDAELDVVERSARQFPLILFANDKRPGETNATQIANVNSFFTLEDVNVRNLWISDRTVRLDSGESWEDSALFRVSSQPPAPPDAFIYVGLNRVIFDLAFYYETTRVGCGIKEATFWLR